MIDSHYQDGSKSVRCAGTSSRVGFDRFQVSGEKPRRARLVEPLAFPPEIQQHRQDVALGGTTSSVLHLSHRWLTCRPRSSCSPSCAAECRHSTRTSKTLYRLASCRPARSRASPRLPSPTYKFVKPCCCSTLSVKRHRAYPINSASFVGVVQHDAHIVATLFKVHKQAKANHKISSLYIIDAIAREARQQIKKGKDRTASDTPTQDGSGAEDTARLGKKTSKNGTCAGFLTKIENFLVRVVAEVIDKGPPEHKVR